MPCNIYLREKTFENGKYFKNTLLNMSYELFHCVCKAYFSILYML